MLTYSKQYKILLIVLTNTVVYPWAMMIHFANTSEMNSWEHNALITERTWTQAIISISQEEYYEKQCNECLALTADILNSDEHAQA